jgi:signal transduction histidine kinase
MVFSILLSAFISILLVSSFTMKTFMGYSHQRDRDIALTLAEALSSVESEEQLEMVLHSLGSPKTRTGRQMMGPMMGSRPSEKSPATALKRMPSLMISTGDEVIPLLIVDRNGKVIQGQSHDYFGVLGTTLHPDSFTQGAPFYLQGVLAGYVLTGRQVGVDVERGELSYYHSIFRGIFIYPTFAALMASLLGALMLGKALKPLKSLYQGVVTIGKGDYAYRVQLPRKTFLNSDDDLTRLSEGFNEMASTLEASQEWKKQIITDTAHELRTPVSLIMGNLEMILDGVYQADRSRLESLYRESVNLAGLIKNLQTLSSEESGQNRMDREVLSLPKILHQSLEDFRALAEKEKITLLEDLEEDCSFMGDRNRTGQILKNLLVNAIRHTPEGGSITLRCKGEGTQVLLEVEDTGAGIPPELRERVFDRFFKVDASRSSGGSGLGLSISKILVENQGGQIRVVEGKTGGALFQIRFPKILKEPS